MPLEPRGPGKTADQQVHVFIPQYIPPVGQHPHGADGVLDPSSLLPLCKAGVSLGVELADGCCVST